MLVFPWLLDEIARASLDAFNGKIDVAPGGHDDYWEARINLLNARKQVEAFLPGRGVASVIEIDEQHIVVAMAEGLNYQLRRAHAIDEDALRAQQQFHGFKNVGLIVGDEDANFWLRARDGLPLLRLIRRGRLK